MRFSAAQYVAEHRRHSDSQHSVTQLEHRGIKPIIRQAASPDLTCAAVCRAGDRDKFALALFLEPGTNRDFPEPIPDITDIQWKNRLGSSPCRNVWIKPLLQIRLSQKQILVFRDISSTRKYVRLYCRSPLKTMLCEFPPLSTRVTELDVTTNKDANV